MDTKSIKKLLNPLYYDKGGNLRVFAQMILAGAIAMISTSLIKSIIDALVQKDVDQLYIIIFVLGFMYLFLLVVRFFWDIQFRISISKMSTILQNNYLYQYLMLDNNYAETQGTGKLQGIISNGVTQRTSILGLILRSSRYIITLIFSFFLLWHSSTISLGYFAIIILLTTILTYIFGPKNKVFRKKISNILVEKNHYFVRFLMSKAEILQNKKSYYEFEKNNHLQDILEDTLKQQYTSYFFLFELPGFFVDTFRILIPILAIYSLHGNTISVGEIALLLGMVSIIDGIVQIIVSSYRQIIESYGDIEKLRETFDKAPLLKGYDTGKEFIYRKGNITVNNITYDYGKGEVLKDFSLSIQGGKKTALVGRSGSGKSTLIKLIAGYIHPQSGTIMVDKQKLPNSQNSDFVSLESYYQHIGYLTQEPNVFDGTIYENLTYALPDGIADDKLIHQVIELSQCQFIYDFPDGLETHIGEKGIKLSGGQRQRLAIAKIMLKNPQIILLDEPTSALDSFSEEEVTKALENLFQGKTVIVIAHRLQTVKKADEIIVLEGGKVVEQGSHTELVQLGGQYAKMLELQSGF